MFTVIFILPSAGWVFDVRIADDSGQRGKAKKMNKVKIKCSKSSIRRWNHEEQRI